MSIGGAIAGATNASGRFPRLLPSGGNGGKEAGRTETRELVVVGVDVDALCPARFLLHFNAAAVLRAQ